MVVVVVFLSLLMSSLNLVRKAVKDTTALSSRAFGSAAWVCVCFILPHLLASQALQVL